MGRTRDTKEKRVMTLTPAIRADGLTKRFGSRIAVDNATFEVPSGTVAGFVGPNGSGKSTTLRMLLGLVRPTRGEAQVLGHSITQPWTYLPRVGALIEGPAFYAGLSGRENLEVAATLGRIDEDRIPGVLDLVGLSDRADDPFKTYSLGMKQRLGIAGAMLRDPSLLVLDEPTNGLDPAGIREMRELVRGIADLGPTVFLSSHLLGEIQSVCEWLVVVERGRLVYQGPTQGLLEHGDDGFIVATENPAGIVELARLVDAAGHRGERVDGRLRVYAPAAFAAELSREASARGVVLTELTPVRASLEDRFLELTGRES
jgi:ABC-2 type transport system ATP-binding protein